MRGFGGITDALNSLLGTAGISLQPWVFPLIFAMAFLALFPHIRQNQRTQEARETIRKAAEDGGANSTEFQDRVIALAHGHATTLLVIASEAHKRGVKTLALRALHLLDETGKYRVDARKLRMNLLGPPPVHPEAEMAAIENLIDQGLYISAKERLERAKRFWPKASQWSEWEQRLREEE